MVSTKSPGSPGSARAGRGLGEGGGRLGEGASGTLGDSNGNISRRAIRLRSPGVISCQRAIQCSHTIRVASSGRAPSAISRAARATATRPALPLSRVKAASVAIMAAMAAFRVVHFVPCGFRRLSRWHAACGLPSKPFGPSAREGTRACRESGSTGPSEREGGSTSPLGGSTCGSGKRAEPSDRNVARSGIVFSKHLLA